jgi:lipoprotein-anchoring transpeptidase ErfK/SrfK
MTQSRLRASYLALLVALALPAVASAGTAPAPKQTIRLSNERSVTRWAHPAKQKAPIRSSPAPRARRITTTHAHTEDGFPEVYLVLRSWSDSSGHTWLKIRIPMRPNGQKGWVHESALGPLYRTRTRMVVDRSELRATLYRRGHEIWSAPVGIGAPNTPTPPGHFWIREKFMITDQGSLYGPMAFGTSDYSVLTDWPGGGVIGIHGTNEPALIPGRPSHGCIRLKNPAVRELWDLLQVGTPLLIN